MPSLAERIEFAEAYIESKEGRPFRIDHCAWTEEQFWKPADGYRIVANDLEALCSKCKDQAGTITADWSWKLHAQFKKHKAKAEDPKSAAKKMCAALGFVPIYTTALNLPRREGKSFNTAAFILSTICLQRFRNILLIASTGTQADRIFNNHYKIPIGRNERLSTVCRLQGRKIWVPSTGSAMEVVDTSAMGVTGGGISHVLIDECKDVRPDVVAAALPSILDQNGAECPRGHEIRADVSPHQIGELCCGTCGDRMVPWFPRVILTSSSGDIDETKDQWFEDLKKLMRGELQGVPIPHSTHFYMSERRTNKSVDSHAEQHLRETYAVLPSLSDRMDIELTNRARKLGDRFMTEGEISAICRLKMDEIKEHDTRPAVGFMDCSWKLDRTTIGMFVDKLWPYKKLGPDDLDWQVLRWVFLKSWLPTDFELNVVDPEVVLHKLAKVCRGFPRLRAFVVDDRGMRWAKDLVVAVNKELPIKTKLGTVHTTGWGGKVYLLHGRGKRGTIEPRGKKLEGINGQDEDKSLAWQLFELRATHRTIECYDYKPLKDELRNVERKKMRDGSYIIVDKKRKKAGRPGGTHVDVAEVAAWGCRLAHYFQMRRNELDFEAISLERNEVLSRTYRRISRKIGPDKY